MTIIYIAASFLTLLMTASTAPHSSTLANHNITSPPITNWGYWGPFQVCPWNRVVQGFQLNTEPYRGVVSDDTALNGIRLYCGDPYNDSTAVITSTVAPWGTWGNIYSCYPGYLTGFQLRVEAELPGSGDDTATNNARFFCSNLPGNDFIEGDGLDFGSWREPRYCQSGYGLCGLRTQVEPDLGSGDDTALNNVLGQCCEVNAKVLEHLTA